MEEPSTQTMKCALWFGNQTTKELTMRTVNRALEQFLFATEYLLFELDPGPMQLQTSNWNKTKDVYNLRTLEI